LQIQILELSIDINIIKYVYKRIFLFLKEIKLLNVKVVICFVGKKLIKKLNFLYRKKNLPTDIISFPYLNNANMTRRMYIGDIIICSSIIKKRNNDKKLSEIYIFQKVIFHGLLHLLGFDHKRYYEYKIMRQIETKLYLKTIKRDKKLIRAKK